MNILFCGHKRSYLKCGPHVKMNWQHELFRETLRSHFNVKYWGKGYGTLYDKNIDIRDVVKKDGPYDFIFTYFPTEMKGLKEIDIPKVHFAGDYWDGMLRKDVPEKYRMHLRRMNYDIIFTPWLSTLEQMKKDKIKGRHYFLSWTVDGTLFTPGKKKRRIDICSMCNVRGGYLSRKELHRKLKQIKNLKIFIEKRFTCDYIDIIQQSKIAIVDCHLKNNGATFPFKIMEYMACGALTFCNYSPAMPIVGLVDKKHFVLYDTFEDLENKIGYYLQHGDKRAAISEAGSNFVLNNLTHDHKIIKVREILENYDK